MFASRKENGKKGVKNVIDSTQISFLFLRSRLAVARGDYPPYPERLLLLLLLIFLRHPASNRVDRRGPTSSLRGVAQKPQMIAKRCAQRVRLLVEWSRKASQMAILRHTRLGNVGARRRVSILGLISTNGTHTYT